MQGHPDVIDYLNTLLTGELAARDQYFVHSRMYEDWGFTKLYERINHEMEEEAQHADALMRRILMLEGTPRMRPDDLDVGTTVPEMFAADLRLEYKVRAALCKGIALCEQHKDYVSRDMLRIQLADTEEDHTYWLEKPKGHQHRPDIQPTGQDAVIAPAQPVKIAIEALGEAVLYINQVKGWELDYGVVQLGDNWRRFVYGE